MKKRIISSLVLVLSLGSISIQSGFLGGVYAADAKIQEPGSSPAPKNIDSGFSGRTHSDGKDFDSYAGPILPLTLAKKTEGLSVSRSVNLDFSKKNPEMLSTYLLLTDQYTVKNNTKKAQTVTFLYPFSGSIGYTLDESVPAIKLDGVKVAPKIYAGFWLGSYTADGLNLSDPNRKVYLSTLSSSSYYNEALKSAVPLNENVTVYRFENLTYPKDADAATFAMTFKFDPAKTQIFTYGMNGYGYDEKTQKSQYSAFFNEHGVTNRCVIAVGEPIVNYQLGFYENGACEKKLSGASGKISAKTEKLSKVIADCAAAQINWSQGDVVAGAQQNVAPSVLRKNAADLLAQVVSKQFDSLRNTPPKRYELMYGRLDDIFQDASSHKRVLLLAFDAKIPAGKSVKISASFVAPYSYDFPMGNRLNNFFAYDFCPTLGSNLPYTNINFSTTPSGVKAVYSNFPMSASNKLSKGKLNASTDCYFVVLDRKDF